MKRKNPAWPYSYDELKDDFLNAPETLINCFTQYQVKYHQNFFSEVKEKIKELNFSRIIFLGNTFNYFASLIPRYVFMNSQEELPFSWACLELTEFYDYLMPDEPNGTLYIFVSRSGTSYLIEKSIENLRLSNIDKDLIWLVTNNPECQIGKYCGQIFDTYVDSELVIGLKSFGNTAYTLYLISQLLLQKECNFENFFQETAEMISDIIEYRKTWEETSEKILKHFEYDLQFLYIIAKDPCSLSSAKFAALIEKTYHRQFAEGISLGLFFHGPFQIFQRKADDDSINCIILVGDKSEEKLNKIFNRLLNQVEQQSGKVLIINNNPKIVDLYKDNHSVLVINFNSPIVELSPIFETFILQFMFLKFAKSSKLLKRRNLRLFSFFFKKY